MLLVGLALSAAGTVAAFAHADPRGRRLPIAVLAVGAVLLVVGTAPVPVVTGMLVSATLAPLLATAWWLVRRVTHAEVGSLDAPPR